LLTQLTKICSLLFKVNYETNKLIKYMVKNILIFLFLILAMVVILNFSNHNLKRAVDACVAGSQILSKTVNIEEQKKFCEEKIKSSKND
jgi:hypothetical protein